MSKLKLSPLYVACLAASLTGCGSVEEIIEEVTSKLTTDTETTTETQYIEGVAIDGYLSNAKVCLDINEDLVCGAEDGEIVTTDVNGKYRLALGENSLTDKQLVVQAIAGQTIDMDNPSSAIVESFTLTAPAKDDAVISPFSSIVSAIAKQENISLTSAEQRVSQSIGITKDYFDRDFVAGNDSESQQVHALARALTQLLQVFSKTSGISNDNTLINKLFSKVSLSELKKITDKQLDSASTERLDSAQVSQLINNFIADYIAKSALGGDITEINTTELNQELQGQYDEFNRRVAEVRLSLDRLPELQKGYQASLVDYQTSVNEYMQCQATGCSDFINKVQQVRASLDAIKQYIADIKSAGTGLTEKIAVINQSYTQLVTDLVKAGDVEKAKAVLNFKQIILSKYDSETDNDTPTVPDADGDGVGDAIDAFPNDKFESSDDNSNKIGDNAEAVAASFNDFTIDLYKAAAAYSNEQSLVISPFSIAQALSMTLAGAKQQTALELGSVLSLPVTVNASDSDKIALFSSERPLGSIRSMNNFLAQKDVADTTTFKSVNGFWMSNTYDVKQSYRQRLTDFFDAEVNAKDFTAPENVASEVNAWVAQNTNNEIQSILQTSDITALTRAILANAVYFKGGWVNAFDAQATKNTTFFTRNNGQLNQKVLPMMEQKLATSFYQGRIGNVDVKAIDLDYGTAKSDSEPAYSRYSMTLLLPQISEVAAFNYLYSTEEELSLGRLENALSWEHLKQFFADLDSQPILRNTNIKLPKFKVESEVDAKAVLQTMGLNTPFGDGADFSGIADEPVQIDKIKHKAIVEVDEQGTVASGATAVIIGGRSLSSANSFKADRPFIYVIRDNKLNNILFMGKFSG